MAMQLITQTLSGRLPKLITALFVNCSIIITSIVAEKLLNCFLRLIIVFVLSGCWMNCLYIWTSNLIKCFWQTAEINDWVWI